jgi:hypothetical protein
MTVCIVALVAFSAGIGISIWFMKNYLARAIMDIGKAKALVEYSAKLRNEFHFIYEFGEGDRTILKMFMDRPLHDLTSLEFNGVVNKLAGEYFKPSAIVDHELKQILAKGAKK